MNESEWIYIVAMKSVCYRRAQRVKRSLTRPSAFGLWLIDMSRGRDSNPHDPRADIFPEVLEILEDQMRM